MTDETLLLEAIAATPGDDLAWLALADWLEESGQPERAELLRLTWLLRDSKAAKQERRLRNLLRAGVAPAGPEVTNGVGMRLRLIPAGTFRMGPSPGREVTLTRPYWLGVFPVTQAEYLAVTGETPSQWRAGETWACPVESVSWHAAVAFCKSLSARPEEKRAPRVYRLPTEAEWEYACRGMTTTLTPYGATMTADDAHFDQGYAGPCAVGGFRPNGFGLHDTLGNVWEWCHDWFGGLPEGADPAGPRRGSNRVSRGGCFASGPEFLTSSVRSSHPPRHIHLAIGFRVAMDAGPR